MSTMAIFRPDHEGLCQERPLYCPIYECRYFIPQARIDSRGVGTCIRCAAQSCCFCGMLGVHHNHHNCPVVIRMMEGGQYSGDQGFAEIYRALNRRRRRRAEMEHSVHGNEHASGTSPQTPSIGLGGELASAADASTDREAGHTPGLAGRLSLSANHFGAQAGLGNGRDTSPLTRIMPDPYRANSILRIPVELPSSTSHITPARPVSASVLIIQAEDTPRPAPVSPATTAASNIDHIYNARSRHRLSDSLRRQLPDLDQIEVQRNRQRFALLRRARQREYHRVIGSGFSSA